MLALGNLDPRIHFAILERLRRRRRRASCRGRRRSSPPRATGIERSQSAVRPRTRRSLLSVPSRAALERARTRVDGLGAQARQDRGVQPAAARRHRHELHDAGRRARRPAVGALLHHARLRHAAAARRRESAHRHHRASAEPSALRRRGRPRHRGLRDSAAARQRHDGERGRIAVRPDLRRPHRRRPVHDRGLGRLPGSLRRRHLHRQGPLRRRRVRRRRSKGACRRTRCCRTTSSRASTRGRRSSPTSRSSTTIRRACSRTRRRQHRWVRGDWQILWWLFPFVPTPSGLQRNRLPLISRWKILDNLRRSLMAPATSRCSSLGWTVLPGSPLVVDGDRPRRARVSRRAARCIGSVAPARLAVAGARSCAATIEDLRTDVAARRAAADVPRQPGLRDAARDRRHARAPRDHAATGCSNGRRRRPAPHAAGRRARPCSCSDMIASPLDRGRRPGRSSSWSGPQALPAAVPVLALWAAAPLVALRLSRPVPTRREVLGADDREFLCSRSRSETWRYFDDLRRTPRITRCRPTTSSSSRT